MYNRQNLKRSFIVYLWIACGFFFIFLTFRKVESDARAYPFSAQVVSEVKQLAYKDQLFLSLESLQAPTTAQPCCLKLASLGEKGNNSFAYGIGKPYNYGQLYIFGKELNEDVVEVIINISGSRAYSITINYSEETKGLISQWNSQLKIFKMPIYYKMRPKGEENLGDILLNGARK